MSDQDKYFMQKFQECSNHLCAQPKEIISLKYRGIRDSQYYHELLYILKNIKGIDIKAIGYAMGGNAYIISDKNQKIVLVEHETGLEVLYIAGSIASLIQLVLQIGLMISNHQRMNHFHSNDMEGVEIRYIDKKGKYIEEHKPYYLPYEMFQSEYISTDELNIIRKRIALLESKVNYIIKKVKTIQSNNPVNNMVKRRKRKK